jgi:hypothetical protein
MFGAAMGIGGALQSFYGKKQLEREPTDPMDRKAWLTISLVTFPEEDEYRTVGVFDSLLRLRLRRIREVLGTALATGLARSASPRHGAASMMSGAV